MTSGEWIQVMAGMGLLIAMFAFPVISIWLDERSKRRATHDPPDKPPVDRGQERSQYSNRHD